MNELYHLATTLKSSIASRAIASGGAVHSRLIKLHQNVGRFFSLYNKLLDLYSQCRLPNITHRLFDAMPERDVVSFNTLISAHLRFTHGPFIALNLYTLLLDEGLEPNCITFVSLLCSLKVVNGVRLLKQMHCHAIKFGLNTNGFVGSAIVNGYERWSGLKETLCVFEEIAEVDSVSWNIMIDACARSGSKEHVVDIFTRMRWESSKGIDCFTLPSVLKTSDERVDLGLGMQFHACALKAGLESETPVGNALVTMHSRCSGVNAALLVL